MCENFEEVTCINKPDTYQEIVDILTSIIEQQY